MTDAEANWAAKTDDELLDAARDLAEYTEEGERIIRAELQRRRLPPPDPPIGQCSGCGRSISRSHRGNECSHCGEPLPPDMVRALGAQAPETELELVLRTGDAGLIPFAKSLLENEGIEYLVRGENLQDPFSGGRLGGFSYVAGPAEVWVHMDDAERARTLLEALSAAPEEPAEDPTDEV